MKLKKGFQDLIVSCPSNFKGPHVARILFEIFVLTSFKGEGISEDGNRYQITFTSFVE